MHVQSLAESRYYIPLFAEEQLTIREQPLEVAALYGVRPAIATHFLPESFEPLAKLMSSSFVYA